MLVAPTMPASIRASVLRRRNSCKRTTKWSFQPWEWVRDDDHRVVDRSCTSTAHSDFVPRIARAAISSVVTVAEILKNQGYAVEKKIETSTVEVDGEMKNKPKQKAKVRASGGNRA